MEVFTLYIAVGSTLRRLVATCACFHATKHLAGVLSPHQLGFGVAQGVALSMLYAFSSTIWNQVMPWSRLISEMPSILSEGIR
jgi:hypothetical protein